MLAMNHRSSRGRWRLPLRFAFAAAFCWLILCRPGGAAQVDLTNAHLSDLLVPGNFAIVGSERFDTFSWSVAPSGGAIPPDPANIKVSAIMTGSNTGLFFQNGPWLTIGNETIDAHLAFDVTALDPMKKLTISELSFTAATAGGGSVSISEVVRDTTNHQLAQQSVIEQQNLPGGGQSFTTMTFAPQTTVQVSKGILLVGHAFTGTGTVDMAQMSDFSQIFDPAVPEPSGIAMAALGSGGLGWFGWRRKRRRNKSRHLVSTTLTQT
jgi:PEP-CTERM motif